MCVPADNNMKENVMPHEEEANEKGARNLGKRRVSKVEEMQRKVLCVADENKMPQSVYRVREFEDKETVDNFKETEVSSLQVKMIIIYVLPN